MSLTLPASEAVAQGLAANARERLVLRVGLLIVLAFLLLAVAVPLGTLLVKSFQNRAGEFVFLSNYVRYFATPSLSESLWNSLWVAVLTTALVIPLALVYAYALTRTCMPARKVFAAIALLPLFAPSLMSALSLIYLFGNQGIFKSWLLGGTIYGPLGIIMAQVLYCFPHAVLVLTTALALSDQRLYEAAEALGTPKWRVLTTITLPGIRYGLISAAFLVFTLVITDFGIAKVIGGQFDVLATEAYKQVVGQQNFEMGAVVGMILLVPAVLAFVVDRQVQRRQTAQLSARAVPLTPRPAPAKDWSMALYCLIVGGAIVLVYGVSVWASFISYWPYNLTLTTRWYNFGEFEPTGWEPYFNSLKMAAMVAVIGTAFVFTGAYLIEKCKGYAGLRNASQFIAMIPMAVPGLVLGLGYVFFINAKWNPLGFLYGTLLLLAINTIAHFYTTAHITAVTALKQIDPEFESVSQSLKVPFYRTFSRVTAPICLPAILDIAVYMFVNALTTVSAVIFLYGAGSKLASISVVHMDEAGTVAAAAAMSTMIVLTALTVKLLHVALDAFVFGRMQAWRKR